MSGPDAKSAAALGFLTVHQDESRGLLGGYLILNAAGRPLEFHCTAPVKPNRAQEILYGPTLSPYLYGEQIGQTLVLQGTNKPPILCTDLSEMLCLGEHVTQPVVLVRQGDFADSGVHESEAKNFRLDESHAGTPRMVTFKAGARCVALASERASEEQRVTRELESLPEGFDLLEPFARIRQAIAEAGRGR